jgi:hypothetical protein
LRINGISSRHFLLAFLLLLICNVGFIWQVKAQSDNYILKTEQYWDTYGVGGTCIGGGHNLAIADVDGDGINEMVTGGSSYLFLPDGSRGTRVAPLKIWNWDGTNLNLEESYNWTGNIACLYAADCDGDGKTEILTAGNVIDANNNTYPSLRIWSWDNQNLKLLGKFDGITIGGSIYVGDVDKDGKTEIVTVTGRAVNINDLGPQLSVFRWNGASLGHITSVDCSNVKDARTYSVTAGDLNKDGSIEIVTAGFANDIKNGSGSVRVWRFDGTSFSLKDNFEWRMVDNVYSVDVAGNPFGNTMVANVKVGDVDGDGVPEIVTGGFSYDGSKVEAQLRIWNWNDGVLKLEKSQEWMVSDITQVSAITINEVDGDGKTEIVTCGVTAGYGSFTSDTATKEHAELKVWSWDGTNLTLKQSKNWIAGDGIAAWSDGTGDLDNDGTTEIVTVGCMYYNGNQCDPDLRIWTLPRLSASLMPLSYPFLGAIAAVIVVVIVALVLVSRRKKPKPINSGE